MNESKYKHLDDRIISMYKSGKSYSDISNILNIPVTTIGYRVSVIHKVSRSISEALVGQPKSFRHRKNLSVSRRDSEVARGSKNPNWKGGISPQWEINATIIQCSFEYKEWKRSVRSKGYCEVCGSRDNLEAHHIFSKKEYPHLMHSISNGMCLCHHCHKKLHSGVKSKSDELLETVTVNDDGNQQPSVQSTKVQRLPEHSDVLNNRLECPTRK